MKKSHKLFRNNYYFQGNFRGTFDGTVIYLPTKTKLTGMYKGRFGSTSIREVKGTCEFNNSNQPALLTSLKLITTTAGNTVFLPVNINKNERIYGLTYIDECKTKFPYINEYNNPPFWVVIKTSMLNDIIILMYGLKKRTFDAVLREFNLKPYHKEKFLNSLEIIRELRNSCAHFELVNRFRTPQKLKINAHLISELNLHPIRSQYIIKLFDVLKILKIYLDLTEITSLIWDYWHYEKEFGNIYRN